ncbi:PilW family protein, partial [Synechococcus sp. MU1650]|uniref:PilW family protein n=1 Tax=Synechococcus sp. MU1650 TaxID=2508352 RepID=UPI001CF919CE
MKVKSMQNHINTVAIMDRLNSKKEQTKQYQQTGFTLTELLVGALVASLTVAAGMKLSQVIVNNNKQSERNSAAIELADSAIDQIQQEIRNGEQLIDVESELPKGCDTYKQQGIEFLFAVDIPDQAMSLGAYDISTGKPDLKAVECPIVYGTVGNTEEIKLQRIGTNINKFGYYTADKTSNTEILRHISKSTNRSLKCPSTRWKHIKRGGIEVCIDQRLKRMAKLTITLNNGRDLPGITAEGRTTQRQGSAMTEVMKQDAVAGANSNTVSKCKSGSGCNFGGQPISCDKTSFV